MRLHSRVSQKAVEDAFLFLITTKTTGRDTLGWYRTYPPKEKQHNTWNHSPKEKKHEKTWQKYKPYTNIKPLGQSNAWSNDGSKSPGPSSSSNCLRSIAVGLAQKGKPKGTTLFDSFCMFLNRVLKGVAIFEPKPANTRTFTGWSSCRGLIPDILIQLELLEKKHEQNMESDYSAPLWLQIKNMSSPVAWRVQPLRHRTSLQSADLPGEECREAVWAEES